MSESTRPAPVLTEENAAFWEACRDGRFTAQRCGSCATVRHPPRPMCAHCGSLEIETVELSGRGSVYSCVSLHHPQSPQFDYPVLAALIDLDEGIRFLSNLEGETLAEVDVGQRVRVSFAPTVDGYAVPVFVRDEVGA